MTQSAAGAMDAIYRRQRFIYDLTRRPYLFGRDELIGDLAPPRGAAVLEIGCGTARNLLRAANRYHDARYFGIDVSHEMLKTAKASIVRSPLKDRITIAQADATSFSADELFGLLAADRIFISYALSMIPAWEAVIDRALSQLDAKGELHIVDFGTMDSLPGLARRAMCAWLARFSVTPRRNLGEVVRSAAARERRSLRFWQGRFDYAAHAQIGPKLA